MKACWNQNPDDRPTMAQVVEWSQLPELQSLRTIHHLDPIKLLGICQCKVDEEHIHQDTTEMPQNLQETIPNWDSNPNVSFLSTLVPPIERKQNMYTVTDHTQVWIAQEKDEANTKLTVITFKSSDVGYNVRTLIFAAVILLYYCFLDL